MTLGIYDDNRLAGVQFVPCWALAEDLSLWVKHDMGFLDDEKDKVQVLIFRRDYLATC